MSRKTKRQQRKIKRSKLTKEALLIIENANIFKHYYVRLVSIGEKLYKTITYRGQLLKLAKTLERVTNTTTKICKNGKNPEKIISIYTKSEIINSEKFKETANANEFERVILLQAVLEDLNPEIALDFKYAKYINFMRSKGFFNLCDMAAKLGVIKFRQIDYNARLKSRTRESNTKYTSMLVNHFRSLVITNIAKLTWFENLRKKVYLEEPEDNKITNFDSGKSVDNFLKQYFGLSYDNKKSIEHFKKYLPDLQIANLFVSSFFINKSPDEYINFRDVVRKCNYDPDSVLFTILNDDKLNSSTELSGMNAIKMFWIARCLNRDRYCITLFNYDDHVMLLEHLRFICNIMKILEVNHHVKVLRYDLLMILRYMIDKLKITRK